MEKGRFFQRSSNYKGNCLNKYIKKESFKKDLMNLIPTNHQLNMTSVHSVSTNNSFKKPFKYQEFQHIFNIAAVVRSMVILLQCLLQG